MSVSRLDDEYVARRQLGLCDRCGKTIDPERLEALPWATLCIDDKRKQERG